MKTLILHVGHGKTGSSALQSSLALSVDGLAEAGIHYPAHKMMDEARAGRISSGNVGPLKLVATARQALEQAENAVLLSNENLFHTFLNDPELMTQVTELGARVHIVLFTRNPLDHAMSVYGQSVKRGGATHSFEEFLPSYRIPAKVVQFVTMARAVDARVSVLNYSNHANHLTHSFADVLGIDAARLIQPPVARVNRSLTRSELELQRLFNAHWGRKSSRFVSDALCNDLPDIPSEALAISEHAFGQFTARMAEAVSEVNALVDAGEAYVMQPVGEVVRSDAQDAHFTFTTAQLDVIARSVSARIPKGLESDAAWKAGTRVRTVLAHLRRGRIRKAASVLRGK